MTGTQVCSHFSCLSGCESKWYSQPAIDAVKGIGNLMVTTAGEMASIPFPKLKRFAYVLQFLFIERAKYYRLRGDYVFPERPQTIN